MQAADPFSKQTASGGSNIDSNGSRDVFYCPDRSTLFRNFQIIANLYPEGTILIEEYLDGPQYIVEVLAVNGEINIMAVVAQEIQLINGHFIITGYNLLVDPDPDFMGKLMMAVKTILDKFGFKHGPCHLGCAMSRHVETHRVNRNFRGRNE